MAMLVWETNKGHFRVTLCLCFKPSPCAKLYNSCKTFFKLTMSLICMKMNLQTKRIFATMVSYEDSFWHRRQWQLGSSLLFGSWTLFLCKHFPLFQEICMGGLGPSERKRSFECFTLLFHDGCCCCLFKQFDGIHQAYSFTRAVFISVSKKKLVLHLLYVITSGFDWFSVIFLTFVIG